MSRGFVATLSRSQNRAGWSVIFRHPVLIDPATEKPGRRVRRGLGTDVETRAEQLKEQLNQLLRDERFWNPAARVEAQHRGIDPLILNIFYDKLVAEDRDSFLLRNQLVPIPDRDARPKTVLLIGTTGSGKTTLLRKLIGTTPDERFPSTSTSKTTIHDVEIVVQPGDYRAAVTFASQDEIEEYVKENVIRALFEARDGANDQLILRRLLVHVNERMRFNYVLGNGTTSGREDDDDEADQPVVQLVDAVETFTADAARTNAVLDETIPAIRLLAQDLRQRSLAGAAESDTVDPQLVGQVEDEAFEGLARDDERFHAVVDRLMDEIQQRFTYLGVGELRRDGGWPSAWTYASPDRQGFLRAVRRFSSNHSDLFGQLLTPLVNGMRVAGPFVNDDLDPDSLTPLVFMDGEGLGHSPRSAAAVSSAVMRRIDAADYVVLVDNAEQPMQAAPAAALRELIAAGNLAKLAIVFTHMDVVGGDNLRSERARREHVLASAEGLAANLRESFGALAEQSLRRRLDEACFFVGSIDEQLDPAASRRHASAVSELRRLITLLGTDAVRVPRGPSLPIYSVLALGFGARRAAEDYTNAWGNRLGVLASSGGGHREPWQRVKALARRLATAGMGDEYDTLRPVADLRRALVETLYPWIHAPLGWTGTEPAPETKQAVFDEFADAIAGRLGKIATRRVQTERLREWQDAYGLNGRFSTFSRSRKIHDEILRRAAPNPDIALSPIASAFLEELIQAVRDSAELLGINLRTA